MKPQYRPKSSLAKKQKINALVNAYRAGAGDTNVISKEVKTQCIKICWVMFGLALGEEFDFNHEQIVRALNKTDEFFQRFTDDETTDMDTLYKMLKNGYGVDIHWYDTEEPKVYEVEDYFIKEEDYDV